MTRLMRKTILPTVLVLFSCGLRPAWPEGFSRLFQLTYQVRIPAVPPDAQELKIWVPLAMSDRNQKILKREIRTGSPYRLTRDAQYGNDILFVSLRKPFPPAIELAVDYEAMVQENHVSLDKARGEVPRGVRHRLEQHLISNRLMVVDSRIRQLAQQVTAGSRSPSEKAQAIYHYVIERMRYDKETPGWGKGDTLRACEVGAGNCTDFHSLFISLARASGIPARFSIGLPVPDQAEGEIPGYHCWAEFYLQGIGWVPVDASEGWKHRERADYFFGTYDPNRLAVSTGRDIRLVPKPTQRDPLNIFFFPYVEVDGQALARDQIQTKFRFRDLAQVESDKHA